MKTLLLKNWNLMRILRLVIGIWAMVEAIQSKEPLLGIMGGILLLWQLRIRVVLAPKVAIRQ